MIFLNLYHFENIKMNKYCVKRGDLPALRAQRFFTVI